MSDASDLDDLTRRVDPDRWLSSRFIADAVQRSDVIAVYAYDHELARAPRVVSNPLLGEIRLAWWREVLDEIYGGRPVRHHPTAQALAQAVTRNGLPREPLEAMIDARFRELDPAPMTADEALAWARDTAGRAAELAVQILDPNATPQLACAAGAAWALGKRADRASNLTELAAARQAVRGLSAAAFPAVAHAALSGRPKRSELGRRLRLMLAVARGRI